MSVMRALFALVAVVGLSLNSAPSAQGKEEVAISAGDKGGLFYRAGHTICRLINRKAGNTACSVSPLRPGDADVSFANIVNIRDGAVELGIVRSDWQYFAYSGTGPVTFMKTKFDTLRSLFAFDMRPFALIASQRSGIAALDDLKRRRVNLGHRHTEPRKTMERLMAAKGWTSGDFSLADTLSATEQAFAFCNGWVDSIYLMTAQPNTTIERMTRLCGARIVPISGPTVEKLLADAPYFAPLSIPGGIYLNAAKPISTFGTTISLMTSSDVPDAVIYDLVKAVFENVDALQIFYPALRPMGRKKMISSGRTAPLHPGAERYFREQGLL